MTIPLPASSAKHLLLCEPRRAVFAYFDKPGPEAVCKHCGYTMRWVTQRQLDAESEAT